jgi:hypothetical protein
VTPLVTEKPFLGRGHGRAPQLPPAPGDTDFGYESFTRSKTGSRPIAANSIKTIPLARTRRYLQASARYLWSPANPHIPEDMIEFTRFRRYLPLPLFLSRHHQSRRSNGILQNPPAAAMPSVHANCSPIREWVPKSQLPQASSNTFNS